MICMRCSNLDLQKLGLEMSLLFSSRWAAVGREVKMEEEGEISIYQTEQIIYC